MENRLSFRQHIIDSDSLADASFYSLNAMIRSSTVEMCISSNTKILLTVIKCAYICSYHRETMHTHTHKSTYKIYNRVPTRVQTSQPFGIDTYSIHDEHYSMVRRCVLWLKLCCTHRCSNSYWMPEMLINTMNSKWRKNNPCQTLSTVMD